MDFQIIITCKLIETTSQSFWEYGHQWVICSFLSVFYFFFIAFFTPYSKRIQRKNQIYFPIICLASLQKKAPYKYSFTCFTITNIFIILEGSQSRFKRRFQPMIMCDYKGWGRGGWSKLGDKVITYYKTRNIVLNI